MHEKDERKWAERMNAQFAVQPVTIERVKKWLGYYSRNTKLRAAFYAEHGEPLVSGLPTDEQVAL